MDFTKKQDLERMMKIARDNKEKLFQPDKLAELDEATSFTIAIGLKQGKHKVYTSAVYKAYKLWSNNPIGSRSFGLLFGKLFVGTPTFHSRVYYMLNLDGPKLIKAALELRTKND